MALDPVTAIATAIAEVSKVIGHRLANRKIRHLKAAVDAAERYILVNESVGENEDLSEEQRDKLLAKLRKRFFRFN